MTRTQALTRRGMVTSVGVGAAGAWIAACGGSQGTPAAPSAGTRSLPPATIEYTYNSGTGALAEARAAAVDKFMAAVPNIKVHQIPGQPEAQVLEKFKASAAAGTPPDVVSLNTNVTGDLVASRMLAPLDELIKARGQGFSKDAFYPEVLAAQTVGGKLYGVPRFVQTMLLYYNKDLFTRAGVPFPSENWTWEKDFVEAAQRFRSLSSSEPVFPIDFNADLRHSLIYAWGGEYFDKAGRKSELDQPKALAALEFTHGLRWKQNFAPQPGGDGGATFQNGRQAMTHRGSFAYSGFAAATFATGVVLMPRGPGGRRQSANATGYSIAEGSKHKEASWEFLKWLVGDAGQTHLASTESTTPATKKVYANPTVPADITKVFFDALKTAVYFPPLKGITEILSEINKELQPALDANNRSVRDSAMAAASAANRLLAAQ
jgi:multiple sugar transport system substrate-binding protein